jgi:hypothetical protein
MKHVSGPLANALYAIYRRMDAPNRERMKQVTEDLKRKLNEQIERDDKTRAAFQAQLDRLTN